MALPLREVKQSRLTKSWLDFYGKQKTSDSGVGEKNDAQPFADQATYGDSRALDFNVGWMRTMPMYIKRHLFRPTLHSPSNRSATTLKSGAAGGDSVYFWSGVIFFANTGT